MTASHQEVFAPSAHPVVPALQACPFCEGPAEAGTIEENGIHFAGCADPDCIAFHIAYDFATVAAAATAWNSRPAPRRQALTAGGPAAEEQPSAEGQDASTALPALDGAAKAAELAGFQAWLQEDEQADGCRGLSQLERDQMRDAWLARAARGVAPGAPAA